jgi:AcrR family transcriptional regulator
MLQAAIRMISDTGLTVSLEHISFEDVIRQADVARSTAYRHWPYKDLFFSDLVMELAKSAGPEIVADEITLIRQILSERQDWLETPQLRHSLILELIRELALLDFRSILDSPQWRTYLALHATFPALADGELRDQVQAALAHAHAEHVALVARAWQQIAGLFGYRLRPELATSFETLATLLSAVMRGLVITALSTPEVATRLTMAAPAGAAGTEPWSLPAMGMASIAMTFLEPDPATEWNAARLTEIHRALDGWLPAAR